MLLATAALTRAPKAPELATSCVTPAFAMETPAKQNRPVAFTMVGPSDRRYALGVNTATFVRQDGQWFPVPLLGKPATEVVIVAAKAMPECKRTGVFNVPVPVGEVTVTMYELTEDRGAVEVQRETLAVLDPDDPDLPIRRR